MGQKPDRIIGALQMKKYYAASEVGECPPQPQLRIYGMTIFVNVSIRSIPSFC